MNAGKFLSDILKITCLLVKDGEEYRFIHKSVQEYYAAAFISRKPDVVVQDIYRKLSEGRGHDMWTQELRFLSEIDPYRYNKYGLIPTLTKFLAVSENELPNISLEKVTASVREILGKCAFGFQAAGQMGGPEMISWGGQMIWAVYDLFIHHLMALGHKAGEANLFSAGSGLLKAAQSEIEAVPELKMDVVRLKINVITRHCFLTQQVDAAVKGIANNLLKKLTKAHEFVTHEEKQESILKLLG